MISIIVPTHNRAQSAARLARSLYSIENSEPFEVIFVLDGCTDNTAYLLQELSLRFPMRVTETQGVGAAGARNRGASLAAGSLLLFMDDDISPTSGLLEAHVQTHASQTAASVIVGPYPYAPDMPVNALDFHIRDWWAARFRSLTDPTHVFTYRDCLTGNLSLRRSDFEAIGGFDETFRNDGREDYEFGVRLLKSGLRIACAPEAVAYHYPTNRPSGLLRKSYTFGKADVYFVRKHPEVFWTLPVSKLCRRNARMEAAIAAVGIIPPSALMFVLRSLGVYLDKHLDLLWDVRRMVVLNRCRQIAYALGVINGFGGLAKLANYLEEKQQHEERPSRRILVCDQDIAEQLQSVGEVDAYDRAFLVARAGDRIAAWVELPCSNGVDSLGVLDLTRQLCSQAAWPVRSELMRHRELPEFIAGSDPWEAEQLSSARTAHLPSVSAIVFAEGASCDVQPIASIPELQDVVCVSDGRVGLKFLAALSGCHSEVVALLVSGDVPDRTWITRASEGFHDPQVACVLSPVLARGVSTRSEELHQYMADFERVRSWRTARLTDFLEPAHILLSFSPVAHRILVSRSALMACTDMLSPAGTWAELMCSVLLCLLDRYESVVYEPSSIVWRGTIPAVPKVRELAVSSARFVNYLIASQLLAGKPGKVRRTKLMLKIMKHRAIQVWYSMSHRSNWPISFAMGEILGGVRGIADGLSGGHAEEPEIVCSITEEGRVRWVS